MNVYSSQTLQPSVHLTFKPKNCHQFLNPIKPPSDIRVWPGTFDFRVYIYHIYEDLNLVVHSLGLFGDRFEKKLIEYLFTKDREKDKKKSHSGSDSLDLADLVRTKTIFNINQ